MSTAQMATRGGRFVFFNLRALQPVQKRTWSSVSPTTGIAGPAVAISTFARMDQYIIARSNAVFPPYRLTNTGHLRAVLTRL
jgi:hypothetical protein